MKKYYHTPQIWKLSKIEKYRLGKGDQGKSHDSLPESGHTQNPYNLASDPSYDYPLDSYVAAEILDWKKMKNITSRNARCLWSKKTKETQSPSLQTMK